MLGYRNQRYLGNVAPAKRRFSRREGREPKLYKAVNPIETWVDIIGGYSLGVACCAATLERCGAHREERPNARSICHVIESGTRFRAQDHQGPRCPLRSLLVYRCSRQHEVVRRHPERARERLRGRHGLRRQLRRGLLPHAGKRHARLPRRLDLPGACRGAPKATPSVACSATSARPKASPSRATRARCSRARSSVRSTWATCSTSGPSSSSFTSRISIPPRRLTAAGISIDEPRLCLRPAPRHGAHPGEDGHSGGILPPRERSFPARDRPAFHRRASPWPTP